MISAELHDPTSVAEQQQQQQHQTNDNSKSGTAASSSSVSRNSSSVYLNPSAALSSESLLLRSPSRLTLKRRQESLHRNFSSISEDEIVLEEFVCAFNKSGLLIQGRLFVTPHHLAFLPLLSLLGSKIEINIKDIVDIHQSSVGGFIHNAITIQTQDRQRFFFQSFVFRDTCYNLIKENWLKVYSYALVHGGTNSKDVQQIIATTTNANGYNDNSITTADDEVEGQIQSQLVIEDAVDQLETSNSSSSDTSGGEVECECECITRFHKIMSPVIDETFDVSLERFWDILYGSKKGECMPRGFEDMYTDLPAGFMHWFLKLKRKSRNLQISPWVDVSDSSFSVARLPYSKVKNGMSRSLSYDINLGVCIPTSYVEESIIQFIPGKSLCIGSITKTPSAPFGDQFATNMRYCILRTDDNRCRFVVSYGFEFTPTASWMAKTAVLKSARGKIMEVHQELLSSLKEHVNDLLETHTDSSALLKQAAGANDDETVVVADAPPSGKPRRRREKANSCSSVHDKGVGGSGGGGQTSSSSKLQIGLLAAAAGAFVTLTLVNILLLFYAVLELRAVRERLQMHIQSNSSNSGQ